VPIVPPSTPLVPPLSKIAAATAPTSRPPKSPKRGLREMVKNGGAGMAGRSASAFDPVGVSVSPGALAMTSPQSGCSFLTRRPGLRVET
jgi:hypothetical protein